jgi:hypothetical protein
MWENCLSTCPLLLPQSLGMVGLAVTLDGLLEVGGERAVAAPEPAQAQVDHLHKYT